MKTTDLDVSLTGEQQGQERWRGRKKINNGNDEEKRRSYLSETKKLK
jgi:hypothetical protein